MFIFSSIQQFIMFKYIIKLIIYIVYFGNFLNCSIKLRKIIHKLLLIFLLLNNMRLLSVLEQYLSKYIKNICYGF